jgi:FkbM family methyltransferase
MGVDTMMAMLRRRERVHEIEQRFPMAKRILLGPAAPLARAWALRGRPTSAKATVVRRLVVPPVGASARDYERVVPAGFRFAGNTKDLLGLMVYLFGVWEPNLSSFLQRRLTPGSTFIDVGANSGWFTSMAAQLVGPSGSVVGIEASPILAGRLQANIDRNGFKNTRVVVRAVLEAPGTVDIVAGPKEHTGLTRVSSEHTAGALQVSGDALPALLDDEELARARVVKIDVEGAEYDVIRGLRDALHRFPHDCEFVVEVGPERARHPNEVADLFRVFEVNGYTPYLLPNFYDVRSYMLEPRASSLIRIVSPPTREVDVVFSRLGGDTLDL